MICLHALILNRGRCTSLEVHRFLFLWSVFPRTGFLLGFYLLVAIFDTEKNCCCAGSMAYEDMLLVASLEVGCCRALLGGRCRGLLTSTRLCFRDLALQNRDVLAMSLILISSMFFYLQLGQLSHCLGRLQLLVVYYLDDLPISSCPVGAISCQNCLNPLNWKAQLVLPRMEKTVAHSHFLLRLRSRFLTSSPFLPSALFSSLCSPISFYYQLPLLMSFP